MDPATPPRNLELIRVPHQRENSRVRLLRWPRRQVLADAALKPTSISRLPTYTTSAVPRLAWCPSLANHLQGQRWRTKGEIWYALDVSLQACTVSFDDGAGIRHSVQVSAGSVFEAAALALHLFERGGAPPAPAAHLEIAAQAPVVRHSVNVQRVRDWLAASGKTPKEQALKSHLRELG